MMPEAPDLLVIIAGEHIREMTHAEAHLGAECRREQLACNFGRVDRRWRIEAIVAIAASFGRVLAEVTQQDGAAAARRLDKGGKRVEALALGRAAFGFDLLLDALSRSGEILRRPEQPSLGRLAV